MLRWNVNRTFRSSRRFVHILGILVKYGFGEMLHKMNLVRPARKVQRLLGFREMPDTGGPFGRRLRLVLEELGPTFIKVGQLLTTRPDIVPPDVLEELKKLQKDTPPASLEDIKAIIEEDLEKPLEDLFSTFEEKPVGSASIAQVHEARTLAGRRVAVKVIKPRVAELVAADMDVLQTIVDLLESRVPESRRYHPGKVLQQFRRSISKEMDLNFEAYAMDRIREHFREDDTVFIPGVVWEQTAGRILTMDLVEGLPLTDMDALRESGADLRIFARRGADMMLQQIFRNGYFHGDPHPGNLYYLEGGTVGLLDFGMTGRISGELREELSEFLVALNRQDAGRMARVLINLNVGEEEVPLTAFRERLADFVLSYYGVPMKHLDIGKVISDGFSILSDNGIEIPPHLSLLLKVLTQVESVARSLDPDFSVVEAIEPFAREITRERLEPSHIAREQFDLAREIWSLISRAPDDLEQIVRQVRSGKFKIQLNHRGMEDLLQEQDRLSNRISFSIITGAIVVGSSILFSTGVGPKLYGMPVLGLIGYVMAGGLGLWLLVDILRKGRF